MKPFFVYILKCSDNSYYTGHTDNIEMRLSMHQQQLVCGYTSKRLPVTLVFVQDFGSRYEALSAERQIKGWSRKKKEALIAKNWDTLIKLAKSKNHSNGSTSSPRTERE